MLSQLFAESVPIGEFPKRWQPMTGDITSKNAHFAYEIKPTTAAYDTLLAGFLNEFPMPLIPEFINVSAIAAVQQPGKFILHNTLRKQWGLEGPEHMRVLFHGTTRTSAGMTYHYHIIISLFVTNQIYYDSNDRCPWLQQVILWQTGQGLG